MRPARDHHHTACRARRWSTPRSPWTGGAGRVRFTGDDRDNAPIVARDIFTVSESYPARSGRAWRWPVWMAARCRSTPPGDGQCTGRYCRRRERSSGSGRQWLAAISLHRRRRAAERGRRLPGQLAHCQSCGVRQSMSLLRQRCRRGFFNLTRSYAWLYSSRADHKRRSLSCMSFGPRFGGLRRRKAYGVHPVCYLSGHC